MKQGKDFFFLKEKEAKRIFMTLYQCGSNIGAKSAKVFCFFFSKKKTFLYGAFHPPPMFWISVTEATRRLSWVES